ncbi:MAG: argininosuccinate lyase [Proteobacteria bacterium]|nr:argininosuccinate lyase [Pseudomonadota bacterium]MCP4919251.1 argininosuccinate lyase [Pseudomonadota bacterium]
MALWDGRFEGGPAAEMQAFSESLGVDLQMFEQDIDGSLAHVRMLSEVGLVSEDERQVIADGLEAVRGELRSGAYAPDIALEDVHMAVESRLIELVGAVGGKLHTARSRNDQVATDMRLWLKLHMGHLDAAFAALLTSLLDRVESDGRTLIPGFTHLQRGQPIWLGHHLLAYAWMIHRDRQRLADALKRVDQSPLGACAMAGTPHPIDRDRSCELLGFASPIENAMDAVASRDHVHEVAAVCAIAATHLSRMAEELVLWSTPEFGVVRMGEGYSTGSSIMPQKRNPDAAELVRGKTGRVYGGLQALLTMVKGLPLAYNRDLQEDREQLFDAVHTTAACARISAGMWRTLTVNDAYTARLEGDFSLATELADYLAAKGLPFRDAHHVSGSLVKWCEDRGGNFKLLTLDVLREHSPLFDEDVFGWLIPTAAVERRTSRGGTAWSEVTRQVALLRETLADA